MKHLHILRINGALVGLVIYTISRLLAQRPPAVVQRRSKGRMNQPR
jgi:hypothetical protein